MLATWKWVILYTLFLFLSLDYMRRFLDWLESKNMQGILGISVLVAYVGVCAFGAHRIMTVRSGSILKRIVLLTGCALLFLVCLVQLTQLTVERIHFFEYGLLGVLCYSALRKHCKGARCYGYAFIAVWAIGFADEVIQGLLPIRYYDNRDLMLNLVGGSLALLALVTFPSMRHDGAQDFHSPCAAKDSQPVPKILSLVKRSDVLAFSMSMLLLAGLRWVNIVPLDPALLFGAWERLNQCGTLEEIHIQQDGQIAWRDESGGHASGTYTLSGNHLDGPLLTVRDLDGEGIGPCSWRKGEQRDRYFHVDEKTLIFKKEKDFPFIRKSMDHLT